MNIAGCSKFLRIKELCEHSGERQNGRKEGNSRAAERIEARGGEKGMETKSGWTGRRRGMGGGRSSSFIRGASRP